MKLLLLPYRTCLFIACVVVYLTVTIPAGRAANVNVACPGGGPGAFPSISAALNSLNPNDSNTISVSGACVENVFFANFERLLIIAAPGQSPTITAADPNGIVLQMFQSTGVTLIGLTFQGGSTGVLLNQGSNATISNCTFQGNSGDGLDMQMASTLVLENSTIQNNQGNGMSIGAGSNATMSTNPNERIRVLHNGGDGIDVDGSYFQVNFGVLDVENNGGAALVQSGGRLVVFADQSTGGGNLFQGNGEGIDIFNAASAHFFGRNVIRNNGDVGMQILGSSVRIDGNNGTLADGSLQIMVVQGHNTVGINAVRSAELTMHGPHQIQGNGSVGADPSLRGGIRVNRSSLTLNGTVQVNNNIGPGIRADQNSSTSVTNVTISGNSEEGLHFDRQSVGGFFAPFTISGNGTASISCDTTSLIFGELSGVGGMNCQRIERLAGPPRPGRVNP
ncbi:MAG: right-handed parallel beta-helix repeat-containing protein [Acidobacteria bacterium]|nr:right-handed parallel beta-helix repeat-containing protein [Acidobacteriota bacterium]MBS1864613.1 right-handed parallel beta-helix repeat-containing protein [Acidobacteriota bacterium]